MDDVQLQSHGRVRIACSSWNRSEQMVSRAAWSRATHRRRVLLLILLLVSCAERRGLGIGRGRGQSAVAVA
jgi:hypothetical protein